MYSFQVIDENGKLATLRTMGLTWGDVQRVCENLAEAKLRGGHPAVRVTGPKSVAYEGDPAKCPAADPTADTVPPGRPAAK